MLAAYPDFLTSVHVLAPTWRKTQHRNSARFLAAVVERPSLCLPELARVVPRADRPLHGRIKRITGFLHNPRLD